MRQETWEERFDKVAEYLWNMSPWNRDRAKQAIKDLIEPEISQAKKEERERILSIIKQDTLCGYDIKDIEDMDIEIALEGIKQLIQKINQEDK